MSGIKRDMSPRPLALVVELDTLLARYQGGLKRIVVDPHCFEAFGGRPGDAMVRVAGPTGYVEIVPSDGVPHDPEPTPEGP